MEKRFPPRSSSPDNFKLARNMKTIESEFGSQKNDDFLRPQSRPSSIGRHSDERVKKRVESNYMPSLDGGGSVMSTVSFQFLFV